jgi:UDP-GlcNAc:undecaprenyl-phosphate/decaprenyl-phosphate GlcNAc-1-phosphate transferase
MLTNVQSAALCGLGVTSALIVLFIPMAERAALLDHPNERKCHIAPTPVVGGIAMYLGVVASSLLAEMPWQTLGPLAAGASLLVVVGLLDDIRPLGFGIRLLAQCVAASFLTFWGGLTIDSLGDLVGFGPIPLGVLSAPFTVFAIVGLVNAVNMLDGLDGLAASVALVMLLPIGAYASQTGLTSVAVASLLVMACIIGFLLFNYRFPWRDRAPVFMGDAGSNLLGFVVAWAALSLLQHPRSQLPPIAFLWLVAFPVVDALVTMWRRRRKGLSMFAPDCDHVHHVLQRAGFGVNATVLLLASSSAVLGTLAILASLAGTPEPLMFGGFALLVYLHAWFISSAWRFARTIRRLVKARDPRKWHRVASHLGKKRSG